MSVIVILLVLLAAACIAGQIYGKPTGWAADLIILILVLLLHYGGSKLP